MTEFQSIDALVKWFYDETYERLKQTRHADVECLELTAREIVLLSTDPALPAHQQILKRRSICKVVEGYVGVPVRIVP